MAGQRLTQRERTFAKEFIVLNDAKRAAIAVGVNPRSAKQIGYRLLQRDRVAEEVARLERLAIAKVNTTLAKARLRGSKRDASTGDVAVDDEVNAVLSRAWVTQRLMRNAQIGLGEVPTTITTVGTKGAESKTERAFRPDLSNANRALQLLARELDRVEALPPEPITIDGEIDDDSPVRRMIRAYREKVGLPPIDYNPNNEPLDK